MGETFQNGITKLLEKLQGWGEAAIVNFPNFLIGLVVIIIAVWLSKYVRKGVHKALSKSVTDYGIRNMFAKGIGILFVGIGIFLALSVMDLGSVLTTALTGIGIGGLAIGMALQGPLSNTFSGIALTLKEHLHIGDWVDSNGFTGEVIDISLRHTVIKEPDNNLVVMPNKKVLENPFKNYSVNYLSRIIVECGVGYESDLDLVEKVTRDAIKSNMELKAGKDVEFFFTEFGGSSINFITRFWVECQNGYDRLLAKSQAVKVIKKAFDEKDINIPFPIRTLKFDDERLSINTAELEDSEMGTSTDKEVTLKADHNHEVSQ